MNTPGNVLLINSMASDLMVVNAARVSFGKEVADLSPADVGLIGFLMRERHGTPFEHNAITFMIEAPIFVAREWFRHRVGSFNELSARYSEMPSEFWSPPPSEMRTQVGKPGSYSFEPVDQSIADHAAAVIHDAQAKAFEVYNELIASGIAKEVARTVLPVGTLTKFYWTVNARSLMNFLSLRTASTAQREIRSLAKQVEQHFASLMPVTYEAWVANGRVAP